MKDEELKKLLDAQDHRLLISCTLPEHDKFAEYLRCIYPMTGIIDKLFCNHFLFESTELLKHSLFLYEEGYFDCAFYSVRQSIENLNNMLYLADDNEKLSKWETKKRFPSDGKIKHDLQEANIAYSEMKNAFPEIFDTYSQLLIKANKYIHKQGFDTFYLNTREQEQLIRERTKLFVEFLKHAIGSLLLMNIVLDPLSLLLSDPEVDLHISFEPLTEPIPIHIFYELFDFDILSRIRQTKFYSNLIKEINK